MATTQKSINDYNYYDRGYSTGTQTSIFVGPIWVEEALSINISTSSNDVPIYPYSSEYYNRLMLGRYIVSGTFAIPYIKPNYLLHIIDEANSTQLSQSELKNMIEERTNVFAKTVAAKIEAKFNDPSSTSKADIAKYMKRVSREIEIASTGFDLTIIQGSIYGSTSSIEIYKNVKITSVQKGLLNDDETVVELYSFTAQRMPDKNVSPEEETPDAMRYVLKADVLSATKEIVKDLVREALVYPEMKVRYPSRRAGMLFTTDKLGITGPLNESTRCFGRTASFTEMVYCYKFPLAYNLMNPKTSIADDSVTESSTTSSILESRKTRYHLPIWKKVSTTDTSPTRDGYADPTVTAISNEKGAITSLERSISAKHIGAVASIEPIPSATPVKGGSILLRRTVSTNADVGSFVPPKFVDHSKFSYKEKDVDGLRYGVMWNTLIGCRSSGQRSDTSSDTSSDYAGSLRDDKVIRDIGKPLLSISYYDSTEITSTEDGWDYKISAPVYMDYVDLDISSDNIGISKQPLLKDDWKSKKFTLSCNTSDKSIIVEQPDGSKITAMTGGSWSRENTLGPVIGVYYNKITLGENFEKIHPRPAGILDFVADNVRQYLSCFHYKFFEITLPLVGRCGVDLNKSLNIQPFVFLRQGTEDSIYFTSDMCHSTDPVTVLSAVSKKFKEKGTDDSCTIKLHYDWVVTSLAGDISGQSVTITGMYYAHKLGQNPDVEIIADVTFVATVLPMVDLTDTEKKSQGIPRVITDISENGGQYTELYSFVRCDLPSYFSVPYIHSSNLSGLDLLTGSWIPMTPWSKTAIWRHMDYDEISSQYELYKKLMKRFLKYPGAILPDITQYADTFDVDKDVACLETIIPNTLSPVAGFMRGYGFSISPKGIYDSISKILFSGNNLANVNVFQCSDPSFNPFTLGAVIKYCSLTDTVMQEIRKTILDEVEVAGYSVSTDDINNLHSTSSDTNNPIYIETQLVTPAEDIIRIGFTSDGLKTLLGEDYETSEEKSTKTLKGYSF